MSNSRFKTKDEFIKEYGEKWQAMLPGYFAEQMSPALGEPFCAVGSGLRLPNCEGKWDVSREMLTENLLLPYGARLFCPVNRVKAYGFFTPLAKASYEYAGIGPSGHMVKAYKEENGVVLFQTQNYTAKEVLEAREKYILTSPSIMESGSVSFLNFPPADGNTVSWKQERPFWEPLGNTQHYYKIYDLADINSPKSINKNENKNTSQAVQIRANAIKIERGDFKGRAIIQSGAVRASIVSGSFGY